MYFPYENSLIIYKISKIYLTITVIKNKNNCLSRLPKNGFKQPSYEINLANSSKNPANVKSVEPLIRKPKVSLRARATENLIKLQSPPSPPAPLIKPTFWGLHFITFQDYCGLVRRFHSILKVLKRVEKS